MRFGPERVRGVARIMVVDDEYLIAIALELTLEDAGHVVEAVQDGRRALDLMSSFTPDLMITDLMMPRLDGAELIAALRADPRFATMPIVLSTSLPESSLRQTLDGYDAYLEKPVDPDRLLRVVTLLLAGDESPAPHRP